MGEHYTAQQFIDALKDTGGIVSMVARRVGCSWHTARKFIDNYPSVKQAYQDECEAVLDLAESKLIAGVKDGDLAAVKYILSTKGKDRGYSERHEITGRDGREVTFKVVYGDPGDTSPAPQAARQAEALSGQQG